MQNPTIKSNLQYKANDLAIQKKFYKSKFKKSKLAISILNSKVDFMKYLTDFVKKDTQDIEYKRRIIDTLINSIFVYDDKILSYFNFSR